MKFIRRCFTLIELLVVIGIISVLASMLLPSLSRSRAVAKQTFCKNNQRQLGLAMTLYRGDSDGYFPPSGYKISTKITWDDLLSGYDGRKKMTKAQMEADYISSKVGDPGNIESGGNKVYSCPVDKYARKYSSSVKRSYSMNGVGIVKDGKELPGENGGIAQSATVSVRESQIPGPSDVILLCELSEANNMLGSNKWPIVNRPSLSITKGTGKENLGLHGIYQFNYLFADGHVQAYRYQETAADPTAKKAKAIGGMWTLKSGD